MPVLNIFDQVFERICTFYARPGFRDLVMNYYSLTTDMAHENHNPR